MKEIASNNNQVGHKFIKVLGMSVLTLLMLVNIVGAAPFAYITNYAYSSVSVIDTATNSVTAIVDVGHDPVGVAVSSDEKKVYVTNEGSDNVSVIDAATNKVSATVDVGNDPWGVAVTPDGTKVYVANFFDGNVSVINTATNKITATVDVGKWPKRVAVTLDGKKVYVANSWSDNVSVIDTDTNNIIATVKVKLPEGFAVTADGTKVYATNIGDRTTSVIDRDPAVRRAGRVVHPPGADPARAGRDAHGGRVRPACGEPGVVLVTSGPGATNTITGIFTAQMDSVPMVVITGQQAVGSLGLDSFQEADVSGIALPVVKHSYLVKNAADIPRVIREAFHLSRTGRPGPVLIDVPKDCAAATIDCREDEAMRLPGYRVPDEVDAAAVAEAARLLAAARRPVLLVGHGVVIWEPGPRSARSPSGCGSPW